MNRIGLLFIGCFALANSLVQPSAAEDVEFFETRIRPVLVKHCYECHSSASSEAKGGLLLDSPAGLRKGGDSGPGVVSGKPEQSLLLEALRYESFEMPPNERLRDHIVDDFETWIRTGAVDPRENNPSPMESAEMAWKAQLAERSRWWSLQPLKGVAPPELDDEKWGQEPLDRFIYSALDEAELAPAKPAEAEVLLRRLSFVLTGLPPAPELVRTFPGAFARDADQALQQLVDKLLQSPHFGERFARHWMDVVRYTDTYGYEWDNPAKGSWEYRDYLIRAFNHDVGFDQLIREQLAGDLLPQPRINKEAGINESVIGPMFYHLGEHRHGDSLDFNGIHQEMVNNKVDAFSKALLAMTVACARCHDHKLDAISQNDYYALAGVFMSPRWTSRVIDVPEKYSAEISELKSLRDKLGQQLAELWQSKRDELPILLRQWAVDPSASSEKAEIEKIGYPLRRIAEANDASVRDVWLELAQEWKATRERRLKANRTNFNVVSDFRQPGFPEGWTTEGAGITHGYVEHGAPLVSLEGETLIDELLPRGYHTHALSSKLPGAVRLPSQKAVPDPFVSLKVRGSEWAGYLQVPQNAFQSEAVSFLDPNGGTYRWRSLADKELKNGVTRVFTEFATASLNPNFPPRTGLATAGNVRLPDDEDGLGKRSWFSLTGIVTHEGSGTPEETLDVFGSLYQGMPPATVDEAWQQIGWWFAGAVDRWASNEVTADDVQLLNWLIQQKQLPNRAEEAPALAQTVKRYRDIEARIAFPRTVNSMDEREVVPLDYRLNVRGNVDEEGPAIPRNFLTVFANKHQVAESKGSGRLELAEYLSSPNHPQTARVYVNRLWQWVFGRGIVATPNDFGKLGERPSHPELLDWLAAQFMADGWSTKKLVRRLVLSQTFRQSGTMTQVAADRDPDNRLLHHYPTRRLEAEAIRDSLLAVSGRLDATLHGPPIDPPRSVEDSAKRLFSGPLDSDGRRSLYMKMSIMAPPKFLVCFNLPDLKLPTGCRDVTNVPAQALALLNDPLVVQLAEQWAADLVRDGCGTPEERIGEMFIQAFARTPSDAELRRWKEALIQFSQSGPSMVDQTAWTELAHAFFNAKEFIYFR